MTGDGRQDLTNPMTNDGQKATSSVEALEAMAGGAGDAAGGLEQMSQAIGDAVAKESSSPPMARTRSHGSTAGRRSRTPHAHQFKRFMIVPLIVVGLLLMLLAGAVAVLDVQGKLAANDADSNMHNPKVRLAMTLSAFPLGAFLLAGAWWFYRETSRP